MMKSACLIIGIALLAGHAAAQEVKSNPDLFLQCSDYDNEREKLRARMDSAKSQASYMNDEKERLEAEIHEHERELNRLDEILKIMRNSEDVWDKRDLHSSVKCNTCRVEGLGFLGRTGDAIQDKHL